MVPALRGAGAITAFGLGLVFLLIDPPSFAGLGGMISILAGAILFVLVTAWVLVVSLIGREIPEAEFRRLSIAAKRWPRCRRPSTRRASSTCS